jgi:diguanylate cyclase (GGDEF)-like protein
MTTFDLAVAPGLSANLDDTMNLLGTVAVVVRHEKCAFLSDAAQELLGIQGPSKDLKFETLFDPADRERVSAALRSDEPHEAIEIEVSLSNGYQIVELNVRRFSTGPDVLVMFRDVTSERAGQLTLLYSAGRHRAVLEGLREGVLILSDEGVVTEANHAALNIFARLTLLSPMKRSHVALLAGASLDGRLLHEDELPTTRALKLGHSTSDQILRLDGMRGPRWLSISCRPIDLVNGPQGAAVSVHDVTAHTVATNDLAYLAHHDPLTGLFNRTRLRMEMQLAFANRRVADKMTVLIIDLDGFKDVNDSQGHAAGDLVLTEIGRRLKNTCRQTDLVARLGGDEFAVLVLPGSNPTELAARLIDAVSAPIELDGSPVSVGASIGIATSDDGTEIDHLLMCADTAMYVSKRLGKGMATHFQEVMLDRVARRAELRSALELAIATNGFTLAFQPKVRLDTRTVVGFEALLRWTQPDGVIVSPADFVPVAEETGQIVPIGRWVLASAIRQLVDWQQRFDRPELTMAINVSARQLTDATFIDDIHDVLESTGVEPKTVTLELTETMLIADPRVVADALAQIRILGVLIAIDDYGSGNASISYLRHFAVDILKVDRSLVLALDDDPVAGQAVVRSITDLAASLQITTVAEGIEREDQLVTLKALGCDEGQGFLLAKPLLVGDVELFLDGAALESLASL